MSVPPKNSKDGVGNEGCRGPNGTLSKEYRSSSKIVDKCVSPRRTPKFGNLLEVPNLEKEGLGSHSTSDSTDEGIAMDDTSRQPSVECYATIESREDQEYCSVPDLFCSRCYCNLSPSTKGSVFAMTQITNGTHGSFLRMQSEDVPCIEQPTSKNNSSSQQGFDTRHWRRVKYGERGPSMSDAQVLYHPKSHEFIGVNASRRSRRLPKTPITNGSSSYLPSSTDPNAIQNASIRKSRVGSPKPPLLRQSRQWRDSLDEQTLSPTRIRISAEHNRHAPEKNRDCENTIASVQETKNVLPTVVYTENHRNDHRKTPTHLRSKSMESAVETSPNTGNSTKLQKALTVDRPSPKHVKNTSSRLQGNRPFNPPVNAKDELTKKPSEDSAHSSSTTHKKSLAETLMDIGPSDPIRVQGIVRDVLFEMGEDRIMQYKDAFAKFDKDSSGIISSKQLRRLMRTLGHNPGDDELRELVNQVDMDENGKIDFNEFIILVGHFDKANNTSEDLTQIFRVYDEVHGGSIDVKELRAICSEYLAGTVAPENMNEMIDFIDLDGDGEINREELCRVWSNRW